MEIMIHTIQKTSKVEIVYVQDALCGWCYGLTPIIDKLRNRYHDDELRITPVHGGLWPGSQAKLMNNALVSHLRSGMPKVTRLTGQIFGNQFHEKIVRNPKFIYDTEPAARAGIVVRFYSPIHELSYIKDIQKAFFINGLDPTQLDTFLSIINNYGIDEKEFIKRYHSQETVIATEREFSQCAAWGIHAFPSLLYRTHEQLKTISIGSCSFNHLVNFIDKHLNI